MKKFSKILTLLLALVVIVTAFTVVSLATDGATELSAPHIKNMGNSGPDWDGLLSGTRFGSGIDQGRYGYIYSEASDTQNQYGVFMMSPKKSNVSTSDNAYYGEDLGLDKTTENRTIGDQSVTVYKYNPIDYPYLVYSFDTMTPTGNFGLSGTNAPMNYLQFRTGVGGAQKGNYSLIIDTTTIYKKLDSTPYNWQHVTVIAKYRSDNVGANGLTVALEYDVELYVNGVRVAGEIVDGVEQKLLSNIAVSAAKSLGIGIIPEQLGYTFLRLSTNSSSAPVTGYAAADTSTWPSSDPSKWSEGKIALDNPQISYYQSDWSFDSIAKANYESGKDLIPTGGKAVAAVKTPAGAVTYYGNINAAIDAAAEGDTVIVLDDITEPFAVDKAITLEVGMRYTQPTYDSEGKIASNITYLLGAQNAPFFTRTGYFATPVAEADGIVVNTDAEGNPYVGAYKFEKSENAYFVNWDPECEGECDCHDMTKHVLTETTALPVGSVPSYIYETPVFEITENGFGVVFLGWATEKGGEVIDLASLNAEVGETLTLYPIYKYTQYAFELITSAGVSSFHLEEEFGEQLINAAETLNNSTVKLYTDVYTEVGRVDLKKSVTVDLNGHNLKRCFVYGNVYEATKVGEEFVYGTENPTAVDGAGDNFFQSYAQKVVLTITSSSGGGTLYNMKMNAETWTYEGEVVKRVSSGVAVARLTNSSEGVKKAYPFTINLNGGITIYAGQLAWQGHADGPYNIYMDNVKYYKLNTETLIWLRTNQKIDIEITDSLIFTPGQGGDLMYLGTGGKTYDAAYDSNVIIRNTDIVKPNSTYGASLSIARPDGNTNVVFDNCRLFDAGANSKTSCHADVKGINGTFCYYSSEGSKESFPVNAAEGWEIKETSVKYTYCVPNPVTTFAVTTENLIDTPDFDIPENYEFTLTFNRVITKPVEVNWMDGETVYKTETLYPVADSFEGPALTKELEGDLYRDILCQWTDANGVLSTDVPVNWALDTISFKAAESVNGVTKYAPALKDAQLSIAYVSQFWQHFYLPVVEGMERPTITGYEPDALGTVIINRQQYYLYTYWESTTTIFNTYTLKVNYTIDGVDYVAKVDISGLIYADQILSNQTYYAAEAESVANMVRYAYECYVIRSQTNSYTASDLEKYSAKITELIGTVAADGSSTGGKFNLDAYTTSFGEVAESDIDSYGAYIHSMGFGIVGTSGRTMVILNKEATDAGVTIYFNGSKGRTDTTTIKNAEDEDVTVTVFFVDNQRIYNAIGKINITIKVSEEESYSTSYSLPQYITEVSKQSPEANINVAKAMYDFGVAAKAYVEGLSDY